MQAHPTFWRTLGRSAARLLAAALATVALSACGALYYSAEPTQAWVVDKATGQPIEGVVVAARWKLTWGWHAGGGLNMKVLEATTGADGQFRIPGWGPEMVPLAAGLGARLKNEDPSIVLFHPGYRTMALGNSRPVSELGGWGPTVRKSEHSGKKIEMVRIDPADLKARSQGLYEAQFWLGLYINPGQAAIQPVPALCRAIARETRAFNEALMSAQSVGTEDKRLWKASSVQDLCPGIDTR